MPFETIVLRVFLPEMDHLRAGVGLLHVVGRRDRVELADRVVALQDAARILPGDRRAGLDLRPGDLRVDADAVAALGHEVVDAALAVLVAGIPVLNRRVLDGGVVQRDQLDDRRVQLMLVAHRRGAAFEVAHVRAFLGHDQRALELSRSLRVDAEVRRQLHRAADALRDVRERPVREHRGVQRREEIVRVRHDRPEILLHEIRVVLHGFRERAEDDADFGQLRLERRRHRHAVEHRVDRDAREQLLLLERNPELVERLANLGIDLVEALQARLLLRRGVVDDVLVVDRVDLQVVPRRLFHLLPDAERLQPPLEQPLGLVLLGGNQPDDVFVQPFRDFFGLDVGDEPVLVFACGEFFNGFCAC